MNMQDLPPAAADEPLTLDDGTELLLRAIRPDDAAILQQFVRRRSHPGSGAQDAVLTATTGKKYPATCNLSGRTRL